MDGTVLILDYSEFDREKAKYILKLIGDFKIIEIPSVNEFYPIMDILKPLALVIIDIAFPYEDEGFQILSLLNKKIGANVPVIITTKSDNLKYRDKAVNYRVKDYIVKPYNSVRLENSIRNLVKVERQFNYDISGVSDITIPFDKYMESQIAFAEASQQPLTLIVLTLAENNTHDSLSAPEAQSKREEVFECAMEVVRPMLSPYDMAVVNKNTDIILVLPLTDPNYANLCNSKLKEKIGEALSTTNEKFVDYFYSICVTYPNDGRTFQELMKNAFSKIADMGLYGKASNISADTRQYAKKIYTRYNKLF